MAMVPTQHLQCIARAMRIIIVCISLPHRKHVHTRTPSFRFRNASVNASLHAVPAPYRLSQVWCGSAKCVCGTSSTSALYRKLSVFLFYLMTFKFYQQIIKTRYAVQCTVNDDVSCSCFFLCMLVQPPTAVY